jgi:hypothetical protein
MELVKTNIKIMKKIFHNIKEFFFPTMINGKEQIDKEMTANYGSDWLDQCMEGLRNPQVRQPLRKNLNLKN